MIYFISDTHFCHANIITLCNRPFDNVTDMNRRLIQNWNGLVSEGDEIYILGDFAYRGDTNEVNQILSKLKGRKYLVRGNHDLFIDDVCFDRTKFEWIKDYFILDYKKRKFVLFHYPILEWQGFFGDAIHLYGHVHNSAKSSEQTMRLSVLGPRAFHVGVDVNNYFPVSIDEIVKQVNQHVE